MNVKDLAKNAILMALYIALITFIPSFSAVQFRIGEALATIPFFNRKFIPAFILGGILANFTSPLGAIDMVVGGTCAIITYSISYFIKNPYVNAFVYSIVSSIIVAAELKIVSNIPMLPTIPTIFLSMIVITLVGVWIIEKTKLKEIIQNA